MRLSPLASGLFLLLPGLALAGPPGAGTEITTGFGLGQYRFDSDPEQVGPVWRYRVAEPVFSLGLSERADSGFTMVGDAHFAPGIINRRTLLALNNEGDGEYSRAAEVGDWHTATLVAFRVGWHADFAGGEVGPAVALRGNTSLIPGLPVVPSSKLWLGKEGIAHVWGSYAASAPSFAPEFWMLYGVGHSSRVLRAELGTNLEAWVLRAQGRVEAGLFAGAEIATDAFGADRGPVNRAMFQLTWMPDAY